MTSALVYLNALHASSALPADLEAAGIHVVMVTRDCQDLVRDVVQHAPDLLIGEDALPSDALFKAMKAISDISPRPVLMFSQDSDADHIVRAVESGIHAYVVNGYSAQRLRALAHMAQARFRHEQALRNELREVSSRFEERKMVDRAKGILMRARQVSDDDAFQMLRTASMHTNQRLGQVSQQIIHSAHYADAVNRAGQLRMLSQRLAKLHLQRLAGAASRQPQALLADSVQRVNANLAWLEKGLSQPGFGDLLSALATTWAALRQALEAKPAADSVPAVDALAERLLQEAERLTASLQAAGSVATLQVLNVAGRQRMLSQRFAKLTLMALLGIGDEAAAERSAAMTTVQGEFERALAYLNGLPLSTPDIRAALDDAAEGWQQMLAAAPHDRRPAGRDHAARLETVAQASEGLLERFEQLSTHYERSMQTLMG